MEVTLEPWVARTLAWGMLSEGEAGLRGALGSGTGSWRLSLESDGEIDVLSLVRGAGGMLSDVSRRGRTCGRAPAHGCDRCDGSGAGPCGGGGRARWRVGAGRGVHAAGDGS